MDVHGPQMLHTHPMPAALRTDFQKTRYIPPHVKHDEYVQLLHAKHEAKKNTPEVRRQERDSVAQRYAPRVAEEDEPTLSRKVPLTSRMSVPTEINPANVPLPNREAGKLHSAVRILARQMLREHGRDSPFRRPRTDCDGVFIRPSFGTASTSAAQLRTGTCAAGHSSHTLPAARLRMELVNSETSAQGAASSHRNSWWARCLPVEVTQCLFSAGRMHLNSGQYANVRNVCQSVPAQAAAVPVQDRHSALRAQVQSNELPAHSVLHTVASRGSTVAAPLAVQALQLLHGHHATGHGGCVLGTAEVIAASRAADVITAVGDVDETTATGAGSSRMGNINAATRSADVHAEALASSPLPLMPSRDQPFQVPPDVPSKADSVEHPPAGAAPPLVASLAGLSASVSATASSNRFEPVTIDLATAEP